MVAALLAAHNHASLLATAVALDAYHGFRDDWTLLVSILALIIYGGAVMADLERQRERGPLPKGPSRYSDTDADY